MDGNPSDACLNESSARRRRAGNPLRERLVHRGELGKRPAGEIAMKNRLDLMMI
jgi:hypothetical protein